ncbi:MAG TPA: hypothetical protein VFX61_07535 [Micromonosporaceae bacterium]|nr:hypothetical protein [Micromonosporaceae bacterium]
MTSSAPASPDVGSGEAAAPATPDRRRSRWARRPRPARWLGPGTWARRHGPDAALCLLFLLLAAALTHGLWPDPTSRVLALNPEDQTLYEWFLAYDARILLGDFGLQSDRLNAPDGVNLLANTSVIALGLLFAPVTLLFGAPVSFALIAAGNLAATAVAWYLLYTRLLGAHRFAAALGAGFCGFAPGMVSQSNAHLHMTAQWLVPVMVWLVVRIVRAADPMNERRLITSAAGLALVVTVQVFTGEEVLFLTALTLVLMAPGYAASRPRHTRRLLPGFAAGLLLATGLGVLALAYPLWFQFAGPQGVSSGLFSADYFSADLASWPAISPLSLAGAAETAGLSTGPAEYNTFLGWPLLLVAVAAAVWTRRHPLVAAGTVAGLVLAALSLGPTVVINGERTGVPGPYAILTGLPVVDAALPQRFALPLIPLIATVLVLAVDRARRTGGPIGRLVPAAVAAALLPIFPLPLPTAERPPVPEFISAGHWRGCVPPGGVLVPVPLPTPTAPWPMRWAAAANNEFAVPEGFFIASYGADGGASMGTYRRPTSVLLAEVAKTGDVPPIDERERQRARRDVAFWRASCVVLTDDAPHPESLRTTLEGLFGPGVRVADAWTWPVR